MRFTVDKGRSRINVVSGARCCGRFDPVSVSAAKARRFEDAMLYVPLAVGSAGPEWFQENGEWVSHLEWLYGSLDERAKLYATGATLGLYDIMMRRRAELGSAISRASGGFSRHGGKPSFGWDELASLQM